MLAARLHYVLVGEAGRPVLLLHGFGADYRLSWTGSGWEQWLLSHGRRVVGVDLLGHGLSPKPRERAAYARTRMAAEVAALLSNLGLPNVDVVGYSLGARIGLELLLQHADLVGRAVLGGLAETNWPWAERLAASLRGEEVGEAEEMIGPLLALISQQPHADLSALAACAVGDEPLLPAALLAGVRNPVLVVSGSLDSLASNAERVARLLPAGRFLPIPGRNHWNTLASTNFKQTALRFLDGEL